MQNNDFLDEPIGQGVPTDISWKNSFDVPMALDEAGLNVYEFRIWCHLARRAAKKKVAWPSIRTMAKDLKISPYKVQQAIKSLQKKKLLRIERRQRTNGANSSNLYQCLVPRGMYSQEAQGVLPESTGVCSDEAQPLKLLKGLNSIKEKPKNKSSLEDPYVYPGQAPSEDGKTLGFLKRLKKDLREESK